MLSRFVCRGLALSQHIFAVRAARILLLLERRLPEEILRMWRKERLGVLVGLYEDIEKAEQKQDEERNHR